MRTFQPKHRNFSKTVVLAHPQRHNCHAHFSYSFIIFSMPIVMLIPGIFWSKTRDTYPENLRPFTIVNKRSKKLIRKTGFNRPGFFFLNVRLIKFL